MFRVKTEDKLFVFIFTAVVKSSIHTNLKMKSPKRSPRLLNNNGK